VRRAGFAALLLALALPAVAAGADSFVIVGDQVPTTAPAAVSFPSAAEANQPDQIAVDTGFTSRPEWVEQRTVEDLRSIWQNAGAAYGVPWQVLAAINKVETNFGGNMGPSSAGAVGWMQFMPDTWLRWGVDANGDGVADPWNADDAIYAAARYLAASGGSSDIRSAVFSYNHADWYVNEVMALAAVYAGGTTPDASFGLAQVDLGPLKDRLAAAREALRDAQAAEQRLSAPLASAQGRLRHTPLLSDQLLAQKRLTIAGVRYDRAQALTRRLERQVAAAEAALSKARAASFVQPTQLFGSLPSVTDSSFDLPALSFSAGTGAGPAQDALTYALAQLGTPYLWGGEGPDAFDCSGLVQAAFASTGVSIPRVAQDQFNAGPLLPPGEPLQPGDLVFFGNGPGDVGHVGMVSGPGLMVDAPFTGAVVRFDSYERASYVGATRPAADAAWVSSGAPSNAPSRAAAPAGQVLEFSNAAASPTPGDIFFTKNP
jgi:cell wall-associated NlpC family hydrolase